MLKSLWCRCQCAFDAFDLLHSYFSLVYPNFIFCVHIQKIQVSFILSSTLYSSSLPLSALLVVKSSCKLNPYQKM